ncbi:MAG: zinc-ribbon domain-containing protein [Lachnospiraceae bacterium]|nr:zinc-ribbon domain-containing protein [Lachnospiraceae bacterium]
MAFCSQCGARINETVKFCPKCGAKVIEEISANGEGNHIDNTIRQNAENADITPNKGNKAKLFIGVSLSIMAIALLCVFLLPIKLPLIVRFRLHKNTGNDERRFMTAKVVVN